MLELLVPAEVFTETDVARIQWRFLQLHGFPSAIRHWTTNLQYVCHRLPRVEDQSLIDNFDFENSRLQIVYVVQRSKNRAIRWNTL